MPSRHRHPKIKSLKDLKSASIERVDESRAVLPDVNVERLWSPNSYTAFKALLSARLCAAVWSNISDCDEVFNYWEPTHFMLYGSGFQTWEYSPLYAIRSYAYILLHTLPGFIYSTLLQSNKVLVFYFIRCLLGFFSAACEVYFYRAVCQSFGANIGRLTLVFLIFGSGMFISTTAYLPSTFSMYLTMVAMGSWFIYKYELAIFATALSALVGWPFAAVLSLPLAYDIAVRKKYVLLFLRWSLISLVAILIPLVFIDSHYFGRLVIAPFNIVIYNVFTSHGPDLYGTEPWTFYFSNMFLNFNFAFIAALFSLPLLLFVSCLVFEQKSVLLSHVLYLLPIYLWMLVFFPQAHKEERFMFPIYPLCCLAAAVALDSIQKIYHILVRKKIGHYLGDAGWISISFCALYTILSLSRTIMVYKGYSAPIETFMELSKLSMNEDLHPLPPESSVNVCIGKEWYRFPSSFFLPANWRLQFLRSEFKGQLPKPYSSLPNATQIIPTAMNDQNLEETSRYTNIKYCDYLVDSDFPSNSPLEPQYSADDQWKKISSIPFLDSRRSPRLLRTFYIPFLTDFRCTYVSYHLLQNVKIKDRLIKKRRKMSHR